MSYFCHFVEMWGYDPIRHTITFLSGYKDHCTFSHIALRRGL